MINIRCDFHSEALRMSTSLVALLPDQQPLSQVPVIYLLHGLSDNCMGWTRLTAVERYARDLGAAVIMPEVQRSFYTDMVHGPGYFTYVAKELPAFCSRVFGLSRDRAQNYIMGLSMGGYGALKCAFNFPEQYAGCASFSAVTDIAGRIARASQQDRQEFCGIFGEEIKIPDSCDLFTLAEHCNVSTLPRVYMTCGEQDDLYPENGRLAQLLERKKADIIFTHWAGIHSWDFWDRSVEQAMHALLPLPCPLPEGEK